MLAALSADRVGAVYSTNAALLLYRPACHPLDPNNTEPFYPDSTRARIGWKHDASPSRTEPWGCLSIPVGSVVPLICTPVLALSAVAGVQKQLGTSIPIGDCGLDFGLQSKVAVILHLIDTRLMATKSSLRVRG